MMRRYYLRHSKDAMPNGGNRYTLEFLGTWEQINNPDFKVVEFDHFKKQAGLASFVLSVSEYIAN
jgi:hypothetical protein